METATENGQAIIVYSPAEADIAALKEKYGHLKIVDEDEDYPIVRAALTEVVRARTSIEARRKELKAASLEYGRRVDSVAKHLTTLISDVEEPLRAQIKAVDDRKEAAARAIVEAEKKRIADLERQAAEAEAARLKEIRDAEEKERLEKWQAEKARQEAEAARLAEERRALEAERRKANEEFAARCKIEREQREKEEAEYRAAQAAVEKENRRIAQEQAAERKRLDDQARHDRETQLREQARLDAERRRLEELKAAEERKEFERQARETAERLAAEKNAREAAENARKYKEAETKRLAEEHAAKAAMPDIAKVRHFGDYLASIEASLPIVKHAGAKIFLENINQRLLQLAKECREYTFKKGTP